MMRTGKFSDRQDNISEISLSALKKYSMSANKSGEKSKNSTLRIIKQSSKKS